MKNQPLVVYSELGKRFYAITRYSILGEGRIVAHIKYDVTESVMEAMERFGSVLLWFIYPMSRRSGRPIDRFKIKSLSPAWDENSN